MKLDQFYIHRFIHFPAERRYVVQSCIHMWVYVWENGGRGLANMCDISSGIRDT